GPSRGEIRLPLSYTPTNATNPSLGMITRPKRFPCLVGAARPLCRAVLFRGQQGRKPRGLRGVAANRHSVHDSKDGTMIAVEKIRRVVTRIAPELQELIDNSPPEALASIHEI